MKNNKGITLVALVVTIIILLILAGITISQLTGSGIFERAKEAKEKNEHAQLKEEIQMAIMDIKLEEMGKGNNVSLESISSKLPYKIDITAEYGENQITGEYKEYDYIIDEKFNVEIEGKTTGSKATGIAEILTNDYFFEGTVQIKLTASIEGGTIREIVVPEGATLKIDISETEKIYEVQKSGKYVFKLVADSGRKTNVIAEVNNILEAPQISIEDITTNKFTIKVQNNYPKGVITEYKYYVENQIKNQSTTNTSYTLTELTINTEYKNIKVEAYIGEKKKESNILTVTTTERWSEVYKSAETYTDENGKTAKIPEGFQRLEGVTIDEGLVIRNAKDKNEFVWIPVELEEGEKFETKYPRTNFSNNAATGSIDVTYAEPYTSGYETEEKEYKAMLASVNLNKGFYIGRYETGFEGNTAKTTYTAYKTDPTQEEIEKETAKLVIKRNAQIYNYVPWGSAMNDITAYNAGTADNPQYVIGAVELSKNFAKVNDYKGVTSTLTYGIQFDMILRYIADKNHSVHNASSWGNYASYKLYKSGSNEKWKVKNMYDIAGNLRELTMESYSANRICRDGHYDAYGDVRQINHRFTIAPYDTNKYHAFRVSLYIE